MGTTTKRDPLALTLDAATTKPSSSQLGKVIRLFGNRPDVLDSIKRAHTERGLSNAEIARLLTGDGVYVSDKAVRRFLLDEGIA